MSDFDKANNLFQCPFGHLTVVLRYTSRIVNILNVYNLTVLPNWTTQLIYSILWLFVLSLVRMTDRYNIHSQLEHLQSKYIGTGHADTSKWEWLVNQHRDSYCSYMGHFDLLNYFSVAENESKARVRFNLMEKMLQPCGPPADKPDDA